MRRATHFETEYPILSTRVTSELVLLQTKLLETYFGLSPFHNRTLNQVLFGTLVVLAFCIPRCRRRRLSFCAGAHLGQTKCALKPRVVNAFSDLLHRAIATSDVLR